MPKILLGLGSNLGDRLTNLSKAIELLSQELNEMRVSPVYETDPMYVLDQPRFLNAVVTAQSGRSPGELLVIAKGIEAEVGRMVGARFGPRAIDIDLLGYGALAYRFVEGETKLEVPHPRITERRFVLAPLADLEPDLYLPGLGVVGELLARTNHQASSVKKVTDAVFPISSHR